MVGSKQISLCKFLISASSVVTGVGVITLAAPFLLSMSPSARALAAVHL